MSFRKITRRQEHQLVQTFLHLGQSVAGPMCIEFGVSSSYARSRAYELGLLPHRKASVFSRGDHRWKWAIERGGIVA